MNGSSKIKKILNRNNKRVTAAAAILVVVLLVTSIFSALTSGSPNIPKNPMDDGSADASMIQLSSTKESLPNIDQALNQVDNPEDNSENQQPEDTTPTDSSAGEGTDSSQSGTGDSGSDNSKGQGTDGTNTNNNGSDNKNQNNNGDNQDAYFQTSITDGEVVTVSAYGFTITHLKPELTVDKVEVSLNQGAFGTFQGKVNLKEGSNQITVRVTYEGSDKKPFNVSKSYTVILNTKDIVIVSSIEDGQTLEKPEYTFEAHAEYQGDEISLKVVQQGSSENKTIAADQGKAHNYTTTLYEGPNTFVLSASKNGKSAEKKYVVTYHKPEIALTIDTTLTDASVTNPNLSFTAKAYAGSKDANLQIMFNGTELPASDENGNYAVKLQQGDNSFVLTASYEDATYVEEYHVVYTYTINNGGADDGSDNPNAPVITCTLDDLNGQADSKNLNFSVSAKKYDGSWIDQTGVNATCNGEQASLIWANDFQISYSVSLEQGLSTIMITACDDEGNQTILPYSINYDGGGGYVTISVEATTIGMGYLIPPTQIPITEGEPLSTALEPLLSSYGYTIVNGGTDSAYYLAAINGVSVVPNVPADLDELLRDAGIGYPDQPYSTNSLGEFDFTTTSGWMYSVNGIFLNYGFSDCYVQNNDQVRIRFTTNMGMDLGTGDMSGGAVWGDW